MKKKECFNRLRDSNLIKDETFVWKGPYPWPDEEKFGVDEFNFEGVYIFTFEYADSKDGYLLYWAGHGENIGKRLNHWNKEFKTGNCAILDVNCASKGIRHEIWSGKIGPKDEFNSEIKEAVDKHLGNLHIFVSKIPKLYRSRMEAALMHNLYYSKEPWADLAEREMNLIGVRPNSEPPINAINKIDSWKNEKITIYGLFKCREI